MADVTQMSDEALVDCVSARHYPDDVQRALAREKSVKVLKDYDAEIRTELLRRLALRDQQVTLADCERALSGLPRRVRHGETMMEKGEALAALAQLPWPHGSGVDGE